MNAMNLWHGVTMEVDHGVMNLKTRTQMISTYEEIAQVGTIYANGEREIGELIAKAMNKDGKMLFNELEVVDGMKMDRGYISSYFITNTKNKKCAYDDPLIIIHDKKNIELASCFESTRVSFKGKEVVRETMLRRKCYFLAIRSGNWVS